MTQQTETTAIVGGKLILPECTVEHGTVLLRDGRISGILRDSESFQADPSWQIIEADDCCVSPGFIDIHVHGGGGADFMDGTADAVETAVLAHSRHGTTGIVPTTTTGSAEEIRAMVDACRRVANGGSRSSGARILGVHLYGPWFAPDKAGCHDAHACRVPSSAEYEPLFADDFVRVATCAAELPGADAFYRYAADARALVTCGHSNSSWTEMAAAYSAGMRHVDHFWCAMSSVRTVRERFGFPMQGSMLEFVLAHEEMSTEVIADGVHLAPELLRFAWKMKGPERLCLVTDCNRALDMPPGRYRFGSKNSGTWFTSDGKCGWAEPGAPASSVCGMDQMVRVMHQSAGVPLHDAVRMASLTPAERLGVGVETGSLTVGKRADLVLLNHDLQVREVWVSGKRLPLSTPAPEPTSGSS